MDLNELLYWEDIWKLRFNMEKYKVLHIGSKNIEIGYKLNRKTQKVNEKCNLGVGFDDTFKADNYIFSNGLRANGRIDWMVRILISWEANVLKLNKTLIKFHIEYCTQASAQVLRH